MPTSAPLPPPLSFLEPHEPLEGEAGLAKGLLRQRRLGGVAEVKSVNRFLCREGEEGGEGKTKLEILEAE